jgi:hypothetical protein
VEETDVLKMMQMEEEEQRSGSDIGTGWSKSTDNTNNTKTNTTTAEQRPDRCVRFCQALLSALTNLVALKAGDGTVARVVTLLTLLLRHSLQPILLATTAANTAVATGSSAAPLIPDDINNVSLPLPLSVPIRHPLVDVLVCLTKLALSAEEPSQKAAAAAAAAAAASTTAGGLEIASSKLARLRSVQKFTMPNPHNNYNNNPNYNSGCSTGTVGTAASTFVLNDKSRAEILGLLPSFHVLLGDASFDVCRCMTLQFAESGQGVQVHRSTQNPSSFSGSVFLFFFLLSFFPSFLPSPSSAVENGIQFALQFPFLVTLPFNLISNFFNFFHFSTSYKCSDSGWNYMAIVLL